MRIASGDVPPALRDVIGAHARSRRCCRPAPGSKGEFENRLKSVIEEVKASPPPIILFIDEAHTLIGAGGAAGQGDAANLLKPALARGELRTIAATTWAEYKKYFEKDAALTRRFQVVQGRGTERGDRDRDAARAGHDARRTSRRADPRRGGQRGGAPVGALHPEPPAARQVGVADRHGVRAGRDEPGGGSAGHRGPRAAHRADRHRGGVSRSRDADRGGSCRAPGRTRRGARQRGGRTRSAARPLGGGEETRRRNRRIARIDRGRGRPGQPLPRGSGWRR